MLLTYKKQAQSVLVKDLGMRLAKITSTQTRRYGLFQCQCGAEYEAQIYAVLKHNTSCGCVKIKHGQTDSKLYGVWEEIIQRTTNIKNKSYTNYGERGIIICEEWKYDFISFYNWAILNGYKEGLSIDRINNDGNYEPSNCRWTNYFVQSANTRIIRFNNTSGYRGVSKHSRVNKWIAQISINNKNKYIGYYDTKLEAAIKYDEYIIENNLPHTRNFNTMT